MLQIETTAPVIKVLIYFKAGNNHNSPPTGARIRVYRLVQMICRNSAPAEARFGFHQRLIATVVDKTGGNPVRFGAIIHCFVQSYCNYTQ